MVEFFCSINYTTSLKELNFASNSDERHFPNLTLKGESKWQIVKVVVARESAQGATELVLTLLALARVRSAKGLATALPVEAQADGVK